MKKTLLLTAFFMSFFSFSQIKFEKGSFINEKNEKVICLIRDLGWQSNPTQFNYKLSENSEVKVASIQEVKEFQIDNEEMFVKATVQIDRSSENLDKLSDFKDPKFETNQVFLKEIVSGEATLYQYIDGDLTRFFFSKDKGNIEQLIYKRYQLDYNTVTYNKGYLNQLQNSLVCSSVTSKEINNLRYTLVDLKNIFNQYNTCSDPNYVKNVKEVRKGQFHLAIRPRVNFNSFEANDKANNITTTIDGKTAFSGGLELEYVLPTNKNKWAFILEPSFQYYQNEGIQDAAYISGGKLVTAINYSAIEVAIGARHYMYLNTDSRIFLNASYAFAFEMNSTYELKRSDYSVFAERKVFPSGNFGLGVGYSYKEKFGGEIRYYTPRNITANPDGYSSEIKTLSLILSYSLF